MSESLIVAIDSGTSVVKAVAFDREGRTVDTEAQPNRYVIDAHGAAEQDMARTWTDALGVLKRLVARLPSGAVAALAITGQGDGTWLIDEAGEPVGPALLWLDARSGALVETLRANGAARAAFTYTGSGLNACQQSAQLTWLLHTHPERIARATTAMHCKDWLYFRLTGERVCDPSEASFTFGDWHTRNYRDEVLSALSLQSIRRLLPPVVDGTVSQAKLLPAIARETGLPEGLPVALGYVDVVCTALGGGLYGAGGEAGVSIIGSTGMHLRLVADPLEVAPSPSMTGYCMPFPVPGHTMQAQTNMAATLNLDWLADVARDALALFGGNPPDRVGIIKRLAEIAERARPGSLVFHPFISAAGERGPFTDPLARASLIGLDQTIGLADIARAVFEGLGLAARDCYVAAGGMPAEIRVSGGAARSHLMRAVLAGCLDRPVRVVEQPEAGAAGAAMIAAVGIGVFPDMRACAKAWVERLLGEVAAPAPELVATYARLFPIYKDAYAAMPMIWRQLHEARQSHAA